MTQFYIGSKQIKAWEEVKDGQPGYHVVYPDGYGSWSPKAVFEAAYLPQGADDTRVTQAMVDGFIAGHLAGRMGNHTVVLVKLRNGFTLIEESACVDPANYDEAIGERMALEKAKAKVWHLLGFLLATARNGIDAKDNATPFDLLQPHQKRVINEKTELDGKIAKLKVFVGTQTYQEADVSEQYRLRDQLDAMEKYSQCLKERIAVFWPPG